MADIAKGGSGAEASVVASSVAPTHGGIHIHLKIEARDPQGNVTQVSENDTDRTVTALAQFIQANIMVTTPNSLSETLNDVSGTNRASSISTGQAMTTPSIVGGTTSTGSAFTDYKLGDGTTNTDYKTVSYYCNTATVHAITSNTYTITSTLTNSGAPAISFAEVGMAITAATFQFLLLHDAPLTGGPFNVSGGGGTLAITYTLTFT